MLLVVAGFGEQAVSSSSAAPPRPQPLKPLLTARLESTSFAAPQAGEVRLLLSFSRPSAGLTLRVERAQRGGWKTIRRVEYRGRFSGERALSAKQIFAGKALRPGTYRLKLVPGTSKRTLSRWFRIFHGSAVTDAVSISAGGHFTCAVFSSRSISCWGANGDGELGNGTAVRSMSPVGVSGIATATAVNSGFKHACALLEGGTINCWGNNGVAELGDGTLINRSTPVAVTGLTGAVQLDTGVAHTCAVMSDGTLSCWGDNEVGQLGTGTVNRTPPYGLSIPTPVSAISGAKAVSSGFLHTCALIGDGSIRCWGYDRDGELGTGSVTPRRPYAVPTPVQVAGIADAVGISAGNFHTCALLSDGHVSCWGHMTASDYGTLFASAKPARIEGIEKAVAVSSGGDHSCALLAGGGVKCWGANPSGELGTGGARDSLSPVAVRGIKNAIAIGSGLAHSCAVVAGGAVKCWGANREGQLGRGTAGSSYRPISVVDRSPAS